MTGGPRRQPLRGLDRRHDHAARRPAVGRAPRRRPRRPRRLRALRAGAARRRPAGEARVFLGTALGDTSPVRDRHAAARRRAAARARHRRSTSTSTRPSSTACSSTPARSWSTASRSSRPSSAYVEPGRTSLAARGARGQPPRAARRAAVRRGDRDVVELRRPHPRRGRRRPARSGRPRSPATARSSPTARTSPTDASASSSATTCRPSPRPPSPRPASSRAR